MKYIYLLLFTTSLMAADISKTENEVREYIKLKKETVQTKNNWNFEKSVLKSDLSLIEKQKTQLKEQKELLEKVTQEQIKEQQNKEAVLKGNAEKLAEYEKLYNQSVEHINKLEQFLPQFLVKKIDGIKAKLDDEATIAKKLSINFAILNEVNQAAETWNYSKETISVEDKNVLANVLFAGISSGYAVTNDQSKTYIGYVENGKWIWENNVKFSKEIKSAVNTFKSNSIVDTSLPFAGGVK